MRNNQSGKSGTTNTPEREVVWSAMQSVKVCIVGGIFDKPAEYRQFHSLSPETVLVDGLRSYGVDAIGVGYSQMADHRYADIIHVHHFGRGALTAAATFRKCKFVFTTHDPLAMNGLPIGIRRKLTDGYVIRRADAVIALSNAEKDFLCANHRVRANKVIVIRNGIDTDLFKPLTAPSRATAQLLFVGQLQKFKGLDYLLRALPDVRQTCHAVTLKVVFHTSSLIDYYRELARSHGVADIVEFDGAKSPSELARLYGSSTLIISPSLGECLSTVVLEAMACECPVIATNVGGAREQLGGLAGVIVPPADPDRLAQEICTLLADARRRAAMGTAGRERALTMFSIRQMLDGHIELYQRLLEADRG